MLKTLLKVYEYHAWTMRRLLVLVLLALSPWVAGCRRAPVTVTILHFNDVYEIDALEGGHSGGPLRSSIP